VLNLLSNAIKFTPAGGRVELSADRDGRGRLNITIADTGIEIAQKDIARIQEPFEQVRASPRHDIEGTGLGLPLAKGQLELQGGKLHISSKLGRGTTVVATFPANRVREGQADDN
jgi:signal transduction histidine kinase